MREASNSLVDRVLDQMLWLAEQPEHEGEHYGESWILNQFRKKEWSFMQSVKVSKAALLEKLHENRQKHGEQFEEAVIEFRRAIENRLQAFAFGPAKELARLTQERGTTIDRVLKDLDEQLRSEEFSDLVVLRGMAPKHNLKDYDRAIAMVEMSVDDEIELQQHEFRELVLDEWDWSDRLSTTRAQLSVYSNKLRN